MLAQPVLDAGGHPAPAAGDVVRPQERAAGVAPDDEAIVYRAENFWLHFNVVEPPVQVAV